MEKPSESLIPSEITAMDIDVFAEQFMSETEIEVGGRLQTLLQFKAWVLYQRKKEGRPIPQSGRH